MPAPDTFLDTNILLYAISSNEPAKQSIAISIVAKALRDRRSIISSQVVQECLNVASGKLESTFPGSVRAWLHNYLMPLCTVFPSEELYLRAIEIRDRYRFSFYDSCVVASALVGGCSRLLTEDLQDGQVIEGLVVINPFRSQ